MSQSNFCVCKVEIKRWDGHDGRRTEFPHASQAHITHRLPAHGSAWASHISRVGVQTPGLVVGMTEKRPPQPIPCLQKPQAEILALTT